MTLTLSKPSPTQPLNAPTIRQLPNGLTIIAEELPIEAVNLSLWLNLGSAAEFDDINGMAHFLEHIIFKGTAKLDSGEFERLIEQRGAVTNAMTSQDYTNYYITTAPKDFGSLAPLLLEVVLNASIPQVAFERERLVVLEEIRRSQDNPSRRCYRRTMETAFERLPYRRPVLGSASVVSQLTPQQMRDFHRDRYQPQSITAVVVGNLPVEQLIDTVTDAYTQARGTTELNNPKTSQLQPPLWDSTSETPFTKIVRREFVDAGLQQARLVMLWRVPGLEELLPLDSPCQKGESPEIPRLGKTSLGAIALADPQKLVANAEHQKIDRVFSQSNNTNYALDVLATILGQGRTSRLFRDLRENRGLVSSISASNMTQRLQGIFYISARLREENVAEVEEAIASHIRTLHADPVTEAEISRVRRLVANRFIFANETPGARASLYGYYQSMYRDLTPALNYPARIQSLSAIDLQETVRKYLLPDAYGITINRPKKN